MSVNLEAHKEGKGKATPPGKKIVLTPQQPPAQTPGGAFSWRYVVGSFQVQIPVVTGDKILPSEENTLAIMKWRLQQMLPSNRWYLVLECISSTSRRVSTGWEGTRAAFSHRPTVFLLHSSCLQKRPGSSTQAKSARSCSIASATSCWLVCSSARAKPARPSRPWEPRHRGGGDASLQGKTEGDGGNGPQRKTDQEPASDSLLLLTSRTWLLDGLFDCSPLVGRTCRLRVRHPSSFCFMRRVGGFRRTLRQPFRRIPTSRAAPTLPRLSAHAKKPVPNLSVATGTDFARFRAVCTNSVRSSSCFPRAFALHSNGNKNMKLYTRSLAQRTRQWRVRRVCTELAACPPRRALQREGNITIVLAAAISVFEFRVCGCELCIINR